MSIESILCTVNKDVAAPFLQNDTVKGFSLLHLPLETYQYHPIPEESELVKAGLEDYAFIIHGNLRNTRSFARWMEEEDLKEQARQRVNLAGDQPTADFLEEIGIPAILPRKDAKPIDVLEFLLRISREGNSLYPTTEQKTEEIPGLLQELEMPVTEFTVCKEVSIPVEKLKEYRERVVSVGVEAVLFHNRSSIIRIKKAFPELDLSSVKRIAGSRGVAEKLKEEGLEADVQAQGSWTSISAVLEELDYY